MAIARRKPDPDGITTAQLAGTVGRYVSRKPLDVEAAVTELREIANGRGLLAERAGITLGFYARDNRDEWQRKALQAALLIAAGADLTRLTEWIAEARSEPRGSARRGAQRETSRALAIIRLPLRPRGISAGDTRIRPLLPNVVRPRGACSSGHSMKTAPMRESFRLPNADYFAWSECLGRPRGA
jgi:hypothetical protein